MSWDEFGQVLYHWLSLALTEEAIQRCAQEWHTGTCTPEMYTKLRKELICVETWILQDIVQCVVEDSGRLFPVLDSVYTRVYEEIVHPEDVDFQTWMASVVTRWEEYTTAMETEHPRGPLWVLAKVIDIHLYGECRKDLQAQFAMTIHIATRSKHLRESLEEYEIC